MQIWNKQSKPASIKQEQQQITKEEGKGQTIGAACNFAQASQGLSQMLFGERRC